MNSSLDHETASIAAVYRADLAWLDRLIEREILRLRAHYELTLDELRGLYISDHQVDELLRERLPDDNAAGPVQRLTDAACGLRAQRRADTPLASLAHRLELSGADADLLLLALAPELDIKYETLYAYLNNDITRKQLTVDLARRLLRDAGAQNGPVAVSPGDRPFQVGLCEAIDPGEGRSMLATGIWLTPPAARFLLGVPVQDPRLPDGIRPLAMSTLDDDDGLLSEAARHAVAQFGERHPPQPGLVVCTGEAALEQLAAVRRYAASHDHLVLTVPLAALAREGNWPQTRDRIRTLALLATAVVMVFDDLDAFPREPAPLLQLSRQVRELAASGVPVVWAVSPGTAWTEGVVDLPFVEFVLPDADSQARAASWRNALSLHGISTDPAIIDILAERFTLPCSRITAAAHAALDFSRNDAQDDVQACLWQAARRHSGQSLAQLATLIIKPHTWKQLVLPEATLRQVEEIASSIAQRERVFRRWCMAERTGRGNGLMVMFTGSSGTGKTMTAAVIANDLGLDLYGIDLASVVSKYIGETEKNLDRIFQAARRSNAMLFFDEADALLGKRSEVKDAHDRYANIEVAYLLQKMEEHDGVVILASNMAKNLDQAFARRMHYVVEFPRPDAQMRERLWRGMFPSQAPLSDEVDFTFLAQQFDTSGGEIQTIALDAAFLASAEGDAIDMSHLVRAIARQQLKQGNPGSMSSFKQYHALARRGSMGQQGCTGAGPAPSPNGLLVHNKGL